MTFIARLLLPLVLLCAAPLAWSDVQPEPLSAFPRSLLAVKTHSGRVINFKIWSADTPQREEQGLMFIRRMDDHAGMLFLFPEYRRVTMWMKNTYLPLDMLFLDRDGKIDAIAEAKPLSEDIVGPSTPEYAVLELKGGTAASMGIQVGDRVAHPAFAKRK